jgi:hypothetical protein
MAVRASSSTVTNGLVNLPSAFTPYLQGDFLVKEVGQTGSPDEVKRPDGPLWKVRVNHQFVTGLREPLRRAGVDAGDTVLIVFDPAQGTADLSVGGESLRFEYSGND